MTKANFGWVGRSPTLQLSKKLFTAVFRHAHRVRYSSPWVRALLFGANVHLDCTWCTRLVGALARGSMRQMLPWSTRRGSPSATLDAWLVGRGWHRLRPWHWRHADADTELDLRPPARASPDRAERLQHSVRVGWRAWCARQWLRSGRHEVRGLGAHWVGGPGFTRVAWENTRVWAATSGAAATVALAATFSPATWRAVRNPPAEASMHCVWGACRRLGTWNHICWECEDPESGPRPLKPRNPFLARFGWKVWDVSEDVAAQVRRHLVRCQLALWDRRYPSP